MVLQNQIGCTMLFTGLPAAGKTTLAHAVGDCMSHKGQIVTLLDGDHMRQVLSPELGYCREDRNAHLMRLAFVAGEITRHGGVTICALVAPYETARIEFQHRIERYGLFLLVYVSTALEVCAERDPKGLYRRSRA